MRELILKGIKARSATASMMCSVKEGCEMMKSVKSLMSRMACLLLLMLMTGQVSAEVTQTTYYHVNLQGTPVAASDESGNVKWHQFYTTYGYHEGNEGQSEDFNHSNFGLSGHVEDQLDDLLLVYMQARYYDPLTGRFLSIDPVGFSEANPQSFNRYAYGNNNPLKFIDPDGELPVFVVPLLYSAATFIAKEIALEAARYATNGATDFLSARRMAKKVAQKFGRESATIVRKVDGTKKGGPEVGGGANLKNLSLGEQKRIQNAADKSGADITVVGSQTTGSRPGSDFDFILEGGTSRSRSKIKNSLPQGPRGTGEGNGRDFLKGPVDKSLPHIKFKSKPKG